MIPILLWDTKVGPRVENAKDDPIRTYVRRVSTSLLPPDFTVGISTLYKI